MTVSSYTPSYAFRLIDFNSPIWSGDEHDNWTQLDSLLSSLYNNAAPLSSVSGTANAIALTNTTPILAYSSGQSFSFIAASTNTAAITVNVDGIGAVAVIANNAALPASAIIAGDFVRLYYNGTQFVLQTPTRINQVLTGTTFVNGNLGVGVASPTARLSVAGDASLPMFSFKAGVAATGFGAYTNHVGSLRGIIGFGAGGAIGFGSINDFVIRAESALVFALGNAPAAIIDGSMNFIVGATSATCHTLAKGAALNDFVANISGTVGGSTQFYSGNTSGFNAAAACQKVSGNASTGRSINAAGTVNASGTDYAEFISKSADCGLISKGDICGITVDGELTDKFSQAIAFVIKSTDPAYVGGDRWAAHLGDRPEVDANAAATMRKKQRKDQTAYDDAHELVRQTVDRIAFTGQVPINGSGFKPGDVVYAAEGPNDTIIAAYAGEPVGKCWKVLEDGRPWCKVL